MNGYATLWGSFLFCSFLGTVLHFVYEFSGENIILGLFTPINESVWEHLKLVYVPFLLFALLLYSCSSLPNGFTAMAVGAVWAMFLILLLFYGYTAILGKDVLLLDLLIFYLSVAMGCIKAQRIWNTYPHFLPLLYRTNHLGIYLFGIMILVFAFCTLFPPKYPIFQTPN